MDFSGKPARRGLINNLSIVDALRNKVEKIGRCRKQKLWTYGGISGNNVRALLSFKSLLNFSEVHLSKGCQLRIHGTSVGITNCTFSLLMGNQLHFRPNGSGEIVCVVFYPENNVKCTYILLKTHTRYRIFLYQSVRPDRPFCPIMTC